MSKGADRQTAEDIAQEVALRAMKRRVGFHDLDDFCGWATTVAKNLCVDHLRAQGRLVDLTELPDVSGTDDVHVAVETRLELSRTLHEMNRLDPEDRIAIVEGVNETQYDNRQTAVRLAVRRHRARSRLLRMVEGAAAFWALLKGGRRFAVAAPATVAVASILALPAVVQHFHDTPAQRPREVTLPPSSVVPAQGERAAGTKATAPGQGSGQGGQAASPAGPVRRGPEPPPPPGRRVLVPNPTDSEQPIVDEPNPDEVPKNCHVYIGKDPKCIVKQPSVPGTVAPVEGDPPGTDDLRARP